MKQQMPDDNPQSPHLRLITLDEHWRPAVHWPRRTHRKTDATAAAAGDRAVADVTGQKSRPAVGRRLGQADANYYYNLFQYAPEAYLVTDAQGIIREANQAAALLFGMHQDWLIGKSLAVFVAKEQRPALAEHMARLRREAVSSEITVPIKLRHGRSFPATAKVTTAPNDAGETATFYWLLRNATEARYQEDRRQKEMDVQAQYRAVVAERERISRELHDSLGQVLGWLSLKTEQAQIMVGQKQSAETAQVLGEMLTVIRQTYADVRASIMGLRTTIAPGKNLHTVLADDLARFSHDSGIEARLSMPQDVVQALSPPVEEHLLRIIQEALTNVRKHAAARHVLVSLCREGDDLCATVEDDGRGLAVSNGSNGGFGLSIMRERAHIIGGQLAIDSAPGQGTRVSLRLPYPIERSCRV